AHTSTVLAMAQPNVNPASWVSAPTPMNVKNSTIPRIDDRTARAPRKKPDDALFDSGEPGGASDKEEAPDEIV
ncbi:MAG TPA: hypothetical protein VF467_10920, partial [Afipia sp.]